MKRWFDFVMGNPKKPLRTIEDSLPPRQIDVFEFDGSEISPANAASGGSEPASTLERAWDEPEKSLPEQLRPGFNKDAEAEGEQHPLSEKSPAAAKSEFRVTPVGGRDVVAPAASESKAASPIADGSHSLAVDIRFDRKGNSESFTSSGWSGAEAHHRWMTGGFSILSLPSLPVSDAAMLIQVFPYTVGGHVDLQRCAVLSGEHVLAELELAQAGWVGVRIPASVVATNGPRRLIITFIHPDAGCPKTQLGFDDERLLALAVRRIVVAPTVDTLGAEATMPHAVFGPVQPFCGPEELDWEKVNLEIGVSMFPSEEGHTG